MKRTRRSKKEPYKGKFRPTNPKKYKGNPTNIIYRSMLELKVMRWLDRRPDVIEWSSEELIVPYKCRTDNRIHRYFPDFVVKTITKEGKKKTFMVEVKPESQTKEPVKRNQRKQTYINEVMTYAKNSSKWKYAEEYCKDRGWEFMILTEKMING